MTTSQVSVVERLETGATHRRRASRGTGPTTLVERVRSRSVIGGLRGGGARSARAASRSPPIRTTIAIGVWKTTSWNASAGGSSRRPHRGRPRRPRPPRGRPGASLVDPASTIPQTRSASSGIPIGATRTLPAWAAPRFVSRPILGRWKVTVRSARTAGSDGSPLERSTAVGVSTATTGTPAAAAWTISSTADRIGSRSCPADARAEQGVDDDRRPVDARPRTWRRRGRPARWSLVIPVSRAIRSQFRADVTPLGRASEPTSATMTLRAGERESAGRDEPVAAVVARAAQDDDRPGAPAVEVHGQRPHGGCDGRAGVLHEPFLGDAERLRASIGARHRLRGDRRQRGPGRPSVGAGRAGRGRRSRGRRPGGPGPARRSWASPRKRSRTVVSSSGGGPRRPPSSSMRPSAESASRARSTAARSCVPIGASTTTQVSPGAARSRSMMRPRNHRVVLGNGAGAHRRGPSARRDHDAVSAANRHHRAAGQASQSAVAARQSVAPMSIRACVHAPGWSRGTAASAIRLHLARRDRRRIAGDDPTEDATDVGVDRADRDAERERGHRPRRVRPDARQRFERRRCPRGRGRRAPRRSRGRPATGSVRVGRSRDPATRAGRRRAWRPRGPRPSGTSS